MRAPKPQPWQDFSPRKRKIVDGIIGAFSRLNVRVYRATGGRIGGRFFEGAPVLLLTTIGRKSGEPRTVPVLYVEDDERIIVVASKGGDTRHPLWYLNLVDQPRVEVQVADTREARIARTATAEEKARIWPRLIKTYSGFQDYQDIAERDIPVVFLERE